MFINFLTFKSLSTLQAAVVETTKRRLDDPTKPAGYPPNTSLGVDAMSSMVVRDVDGEEGVCTLTVSGETLFVPASRVQFLASIDSFVRQMQRRAAIASPMRGPAS